MESQKDTYLLERLSTLVWHLELENEKKTQMLAIFEHILRKGHDANFEGFTETFIAIP